MIRYKAKIQKVWRRDGFLVKVRGDQVSWFIPEDDYDLNAPIVIEFFERRNILPHEVYVVDGYDRS